MVQAFSVGSAEEAFELLETMSKIPGMKLDKIVELPAGAIPEELTRALSRRSGKPHKRLTFNEFIKTVEQQIGSRPIDALAAIYPFRLPKIYPKWRDILASFLGVKRVEADMPGSATKTSHTHLHATQSWLQFHAPVYCLRESLIEELMRIEPAAIERLVPSRSQWMPPWPLALLVPPSGKLKAPNGEHIVYMMVGWRYPGLPDWIPGTTDRQIFVTAMDSRANVYYRTRSLGDGVWLPDIAGDAGDTPMQVEETDWLTRLLLFAFQCLLVHTIVPKAVTDIPSDLINSPALKRVQRSVSQNIRAPRYLGANFDRIHVARLKGLPIGGGEGKKKCPHIRGWHMREQRCGPKLAQTKTVFIDTCWINEHLMDEAGK